MTGSVLWILKKCAMFTTIINIIFNHHLSLCYFAVLWLQHFNWEEETIKVTVHKFKYFGCKLEVNFTKIFILDSAEVSSKALKKPKSMRLAVTIKC